MANEWAIRPKKYGTRHIVIVHRVDRAEPYALKENGEPQTFDCEQEAELAGLRHLLYLLQHEIRFERAIPKSKAVREQERVFGSVVSNKGHETRVERLRRRKVATA